MANYLQPHFTLQELTATDTGLDNTVTLGSHKYATLKAMAIILENVRGILGRPIFINSCYRSPEVNKAVGGARTSYHLTGSAVDIRTYHYSDSELSTLESALRSYYPCEFIKYDTFWHVAFDISRLGTDSGVVTTWNQECPESCDPINTTVNSDL